MYLSMIMLTMRRAKSNYTILLVTLIGLLQLQSSCNRGGIDCTERKTFTNLTSNDVSKVPYKGYDTLKFLSNKGDTNIVVGSAKEFYYGVKMYGPADCGMDNYKDYYQAFKISFKPIKGDLDFTLVEQKIDQSLIFKKSNYYNVTPVLELGLIGTRNDSVWINGWLYYSLNTFIPFSHDSPSPDHSYTISFNRSYGVLYIKSEQDNEEYSILR